jgi:hypothetical protein
MAAQLRVRRSGAEGEKEREREAGHEMKSRMTWNTCFEMAVPEGVQQPRDYKGLRCLTGPKGPFEAKSNSRGLSNCEPLIADVIQSDDGRYRLGLYDDTSPGFETRTFAASVLALERPPPGPELRSPAAEGDGANRKTEEQPEENTTSALRPQEVSTSWGSA